MSSELCNTLAYLFLWNKSVSTRRDAFILTITWVYLDRL